MKLYASLCALLCAIPTAYAADYQGAYLGALSGYSWSQDDGVAYSNSTGNKNGWTQTTNPTAINYGVYAGYNWLVNDTLLLGVEIDFQDHTSSTDTSHQQTNGVTDPQYQGKTTLHEAASLRGRAGYLWNSNTLLYATAGASTVKVARGWMQSGVVRETHERWHNGWVAGVGIEYMATSNLAARAEYRYADYASEQVPANIWTETYRQRLTTQSVLLGLGYHF